MLSLKSVNHCKFNIEPNWENLCLMKEKNSRFDPIAKLFVETTILDQTPIFEWLVYDTARSYDRHPRHMCYIEIGLCAQM